MNVRLRNGLVTALHTVLWWVPIFCIGWVIWQMEGRERPTRTAVGLAACGLFLVTMFAWFTFRDLRAARELDRLLRDAGIPPERIPEEPLAIIPRLRLAKDRDQLVAGVLFLLLLTFVFIAYYAGWIGRWTGHPMEE